MDELGKDLDGALVSRLGDWQEALEAEPRGTDETSLFCLYPKMLSYMAWTCGTYAQAERTQAAIDLRTRSYEERRKAAEMATNAASEKGIGMSAGVNHGPHHPDVMGLAACCPCCGQKAPMGCGCSDMPMPHEQALSRSASQGHAPGDPRTQDLRAEDPRDKRADDPDPDQDEAEASARHQEEEVLVHRETRIVEDTVIEEVDDDETCKRRGSRGRGRGRCGDRGR